MVLPARILWPLYINPRYTSWSTLYKSLTSYPDTQYNIVVNPGSGPGDYEFCPPWYTGNLAQLRTYPNAHLLGYVHVSWATRPIDDVKADINKYKHWDAFPGPGKIKMDGIFFDEAPKQYSTANYAYMSNVSSFAHSKPFSTVVFNPGEAPASQYYAIAEQIVVWENYYSNWKSSVISNIPNRYRSKSALVVHDFTGTSRQQNSFVQNALDNGIGGLFVTTLAVYDGWSGVWSQFLASFDRFV